MCWSVGGERAVTLEASATVGLPCPLCAAAAYRTVKVFSDGVVVGECGNCGLLYTPLRHPSPDTLFAGTQPLELRVLLRPITLGLKQHYRDRSFRAVLTTIRRNTTGKRLLDVGCAHGAFLRLARKLGYEGTGVEPTPALAAFGREEWGLEILDGRLDQVDLGRREWDVITFTDSLEYLTTPVADLGRILDHLAAGGVLFAKVPNGNYFRMRHRVEGALGRKLGQDEPFSPSRRVAHYTLQSLQRLAQATGLEKVEVGPAPVIDSSVWAGLTGLPLEVESPWYLDWRAKLIRRLLWMVGAIEGALWRGHNHFSPSIFILARKPRQSVAAGHS